MLAAAVALLALVALSGCTRATPMDSTPLDPKPTAPTPADPDPAPKTAYLADGTYLTAVLGGDAADALTVEGVKALSAEVLTDAEVEALMAADWWKPVDELVMASPKVKALLAALAPVYDKHFAATTSTATIRQDVPAPLGDEAGRLIPPITLGTYRVEAGTAARIAAKSGAELTTSCYLTTTEAALLTGAGDDALTSRAAACAPFTGSLSAMQAVDGRTCGGGGCKGAAARGMLAAVGATMLHGLVADVAAELSNMVVGSWFMGTWVSISWDHNDDGIGTINEILTLKLHETGGEYMVADYNDPEGGAPFTGSLSAMQAVEIGRTCGGGGCKGAAARGMLAAVGATMLHGLVADVAAELSNMVVGSWFMGTWVSISWDHNDDGIGTINEILTLKLHETGGEYMVADYNDPEGGRTTQLGPWSHHPTSGGRGEFSSGDKVIQYEYIDDKLYSIRGGLPGDGWWMSKVGLEIVGTWTGTSDTTTYELTIDEEADVAVTTSGVMKGGVIEHDQHYEDYRIRDKEYVLLMDDGRPELNGCGTMLFALGPGSNPTERTEGHEWRYCIDLREDPNSMWAQPPPYDPEEDWDLFVTLTRR